MLSHVTEVCGNTIVLPLNINFLHKKMLRSRAPSRLSAKAVAKAKVSSLKREASISLKRQLTPMVKQLVRREAETKYRDEGFNVQFAEIGTVAGTSGHVIQYFAMPTQGVGSSQRTGNKISLTGMHIRCTFQLGPVANVNYGLDGIMYVVMYKDGGNFNIDDFLVIDPSSVVPATGITTRSQRNLEKISEFKVLAAKRINLTEDTYQTNVGHITDIIFSLKLRDSVNFTSGASTPLQNQLAMVFVANSGSRSGTTNYIVGQINSRLYYTDV